MADTPKQVADRDVSATPMAFVPGGTFRMGSDKHYPEEAPVHRVTVDGFWIDRTPVTNRQFKAFIKATGHVTFAQNPGARRGTIALWASSGVRLPPAGKSRL
jgi:formylglycine-generating enzyme required for sulfatase activity